MLRSRICEALGLRYPIFQGGMAWVSDAKLAAAVSNAGGLGIISAMNADENYVRDQIRLCRELKVSVSHEADGQHTFVEGEDVTGLIRTPEVSMAASTVSRYADVRRNMVKIQQQLAAETDMVLDGRDICTTVLPNATAKIFLTASQEERARRRFLEMQAKGMNDTFEQVLEDLKKRDDQDMNRPVEPLRQAPDAVLVDTTNLTFDEAVDAILKIVEANRHG